MMGKEMKSTPIEEFSLDDGDTSVMVFKDAIGNYIYEYWTCDGEQLFVVNAGYQTMTEEFAEQILLAHDEGYRMGVNEGRGGATPVVIAETGTGNVPYHPH